MSIIVRKTYYWESDKCNHIEKDLIELFVPQTHKSKEYKNWIAILDLKTCLVCRNCHGKIYKSMNNLFNNRRFIIIVVVKLLKSMLFMREGLLKTELPVMTMY